MKVKLSMILSKPDGTPQKLLDIGKLNALGWKSRYRLEKELRVLMIGTKSNLFSPIFKLCEMWCSPVN